MSHELETGGFVKQAAWHGLGNVVENAPETYEEMLQISGLDWLVEKRPLFFERAENEFQESGKAFGLVRETDNRLLGVVGKGYREFQNEDALEWCQPLVDSGYWNFEAAGSLRNGEICWGLLKQGEFEAAPGDLLKEYLLVCWTHNGKKAVRVQPTSIRVVCMNTLTASLGGEGKIHSIRHNANLMPKMEEVRAIYETATKQFAKQHENIRVLVNSVWKEKKMQEYIDTLLPDPATLTGKAATIATKNKEQLEDMVIGGLASGADLDGVQGTAWGAFSGVSEFVEHYLGQNRVKDRGTNILYGKGADLLSDAFALAQAMS